MNRNELLEGAREALDEAIAEVTWAEYVRLSKGRDPHDVVKKVDRALDSLRRLQGREKPEYNKWVAPFYISWYQARQVNLVYTALSEYAPKSGSAPLHVVDVGCGAWAAAIALAILAAGGHPALARRSIEVVGIDPSGDMKHIGQELWHQFHFRAQAHGLRRLDKSINEMSGLIEALPSLKEYDTRETSNCESWLLSVHALYKESYCEIGGDLKDLREANLDLRYELITSHYSKEWMVKKLARRALRAAESEVAYYEPRVLKEPWEGVLGETKKCRERIYNDLLMKDTITKPELLYFLERPVCWNPGKKNRIQCDAVYVWPPPQ